MIQMRWGDETTWKDCPEVASVEEGNEKWKEFKLKNVGRKIPPDPIFREKPNANERT